MGHHEIASLSTLLHTIGAVRPTSLGWSAQRFDVSVKGDKVVVESRVGACPLAAFVANGAVGVDGPSEFSTSPFS
jgi:hypothetical protein